MFSTTKDEDFYGIKFAQQSTFLINFFQDYGVL